MPPSTVLYGHVAKKIAGWESNRPPPDNALEPLCLVFCTGKCGNLACAGVGLKRPTIEVPEAVVGGLALLGLVRPGPLSPRRQIRADSSTVLPQCAAVENLATTVLRLQSVENCFYRSSADASPPSRSPFSVRTLESSESFTHRAVVARRRL